MLATPSEGCFGRGAWNAVNDPYDAIIIGSGFGGAVTACRLAEHGYKVLILERGRRWSKDDYPRSPGDAWMWDQWHPEKLNGWVDFRLFPHLAVAQGAGVGGGSLIYANMHVEATPELLEEGWPSEITYDELKPYYEAVGNMLNVQQVPQNQLPERTKLMKEAAQQAGYGDRFRQLDLAVSFDPEWNYELDDPHNERHSKTFTNAQGQKQGTCIHLANCDIGCEVKAKNTLDLNYIPLAEQHGAEVRPLHLAQRIEVEGGGYRVHFERLEDGRRHPGSAAARIVILAAGSLGSTELLLRCRDQHKTLPEVSGFLGHNWSSNGDFLTPAIHDRDVSPTLGPTITSAIDFLDGKVAGQRFFIEDGGFPDLLGNWLEETSKGFSLRLRERALKRTLRRLRGRHPIKHLMPWFAQGRDAANGRMMLRKRWLLFGRRGLHLDWDIEASKPVIDAIVAMHEKLAKVTDGTPFVPATWTWAKYLVTPHPLGGCNMGTEPAKGVVNHAGEVFGYRNLYVADGAIIPEAIGANPSKTIAALAERIAKLIVEEGR